MGRGEDVYGEELGTGATPALSLACCWPRGSWALSSPVPSGCEGPAGSGSLASLCDLEGVFLLGLSEWAGVL